MVCTSISTPRAFILLFTFTLCLVIRHTSLTPAIILLLVLPGRDSGISTFMACRSKSGLSRKLFRAVRTAMWSWFSTNSTRWSSLTRDVKKKGHKKYSVAVWQQWPTDLMLKSIYDVFVAVARHLVSPLPIKTTIMYHYCYYIITWIKVIQGRVYKSFKAWRLEPTYLVPGVTAEFYSLGTALPHLQETCSWPAPPGWRHPLPPPLPAEETCLDVIKRNRHLDES